MSCHVSVWAGLWQCVAGAIFDSRAASQASTLARLYHDTRESRHDPQKMAQTRSPPAPVTRVAARAGFTYTIQRTDRTTRQHSADTTDETEKREITAIPHHHVVFRCATVH
jgi:hypothetical protein